MLDDETVMGHVRWRHWCGKNEELLLNAPAVKYHILLFIFPWYSGKAVL